MSRKAYRAHVVGEAPLDYFSPEEAVRYAASKVYSSVSQADVVKAVRSNGKFEWSYGFMNAEVLEIPYYDSRM